MLYAFLLLVERGVAEGEDATTELIKPIEIIVNVGPTCVRLPCERITLSPTLSSRVPAQYKYTYYWDIKDKETGKASMKCLDKNKKSLEISELKEGVYSLTVTVKCSYPEPNGSEGKYEGDFFVYPGRK